MEAGLNAPLYTVEILRLAASLPEPVALSRIDGAAEARSPTCGSSIRTEIMVSDGRVADISQRLQACAFGQASAALAARGAIGKGREDIENALAQLTRWLDHGPVPVWPGIEALVPARTRKGRHGAILLPFRALLAAMDDAA